MDWQLSVEEALTRLEKGLWRMDNACDTVTISIELFIDFVTFYMVINY